MVSETQRSRAGEDQRSAQLSLRFCRLLPSTPTQQHTNAAKRLQFKQHCALRVQRLIAITRFSCRAGVELSDSCLQANFKNFIRVVSEDAALDASTSRRTNSGEVAEEGTMGQRRCSPEWRRVPATSESWRGKHTRESDTQQMETTRRTACARLGKAWRRRRRSPSVLHPLTAAAW